jgi:hypothetical protein
MQSKVLTRWEKKRGRHELCANFYRWTDCRTFVYIRTDIGVKHMVNAAAENQGAEGLIAVMVEGKQVPQDLSCNGDSPV